MSKELIRFSAVKGMIVAVAMLIMAVPAHAQHTGYHQLAAVADSQAMMAQRMAVEAMLVALDVDQSHNLEQLRSSRERFETAMLDLRAGRGSAQIGDISDPEALADFEEAERAWADLDAAISDCLAIGTVTVDHVAGIADGSETLMFLLGNLSASLRHEAESGESHSMLTVAIGVSNHTRALTQEMTKSFLMAAYGHQTERYRYSLRISAEDFEAGLIDLLEGDFDRLLLPAPTGEIRAQLEQVMEIWKSEYRRYIDQAINGDDLDYRMVLGMERVNRRMFQDVDALVGMYAAL